ncbi:hypothetical protein CONLIGDRAFT_234996 [Coniochaeta ligniaria NRRL 30616]|uniref:Extracellular membrane protein CFEM domain-containing protein n=1 Tax=Coniochaeta ligniaria NRRL 30616 TaxID=1408157 RepID=A0A1J7JEC4_9PEZI|nr:hypothetical protein CONLIGDRAFT_234996 [Coniochaeta ligniaria NRRL 30616]
MISFMTKPTASSLIALLALTSGILARTLDPRLQCLRADVHQIIEQTACGDKGSIAYCLGNLQPTAWDALVNQVETCYLNAGCNEAESAAETLWTLSQCDPAKDRGAAENDLRKRQAAKDTETETAAKTTAKAGPKTTLVAATTEPEPTTTTEKAAATTSTEQPTTTTQSTTSTPSTSSASSSTTSSPSTTTAAPGVGLAHTGRPLQCFTTSLAAITSCPIQSTGSLSGHAMSCFPTTTPTSVCAAGLICNLDGNGNPSCMYAYNKFDTAGVIIAIFFAVAVTGAVALVATLCCREKRASKRAEAAAVVREAQLLSAKGRMGGGVAVAEVREPGEDRRPLMHEDMGYGGAYGGHAGGMQDAAGPFGDQHRVR